jgi:hypothetical protein
MSRILVASFVFIVFLFSSSISSAKVLFLAHWNDGLKADVAGGKADPLVAAGSQPPKNGNGYPYKDSMPAINGLAIGNGSQLGYATTGNMKAAEGTIDFWFYLRTDFVAGGGTIPHLFSVNTGPGAEHIWANTMYMTYGGWIPDLRWVITDDNAKWVSSVAYLADKWTANSRWHRIALSWSKKNKRLSMFIDGRLVGRDENAKLLPSLLPCLYIGSNKGWQGFAPHGYDEFRILDREIGEVQAAADYCREYELTGDDTFPIERMFVPIDLAAVAKTPFEDQKPNDQKGGWTDQGATNDMRNIARGSVTVLDMPFKIADKCIVLANAKKQYYPQEATVPINGPFGGLLFIHTAAYLTAPDRTCAYYVIEYTDGTRTTTPLETYKNISDWWYGQDMPQARTVLPCMGGGTGKVGSYLYFWRNPTPEKTIKAVTFKTANDEAMPVLIAITGVATGFRSEVYKGLELLTCRQVDMDAEFLQAAKKYASQLVELAKVKAALAKLTLTEKQRTSFYGRQAVRHLENGKIYIAEAEALGPQIDRAIKIKDVRQMRNMEKGITYIKYAGEIVKLIRDLQAKADKAVLMTPITPSPAAFSAAAAQMFRKYGRCEIVLNGPWQANYAEDPEMCGKEWTPLVIPVVSNGCQSTWLKKTIDTPAEWAGRNIELVFEASHELTEVYVNRRFVGRHIGIEPFTVDLSEAMVPGAANEVLLFIGGKSYTKNSYSNATDYPTNQWCQPGITQDVYLKVAPRTSIVEPFARLDRENNFILTGKIANAGNREFELAAAVEHNKETHSFGTFKIKPGTDGAFTISAKWDKPVLWGIGGRYQTPRLVFVNLKLSAQGKGVDETSFRTGFRRFEVKDKLWFALNGIKIILQGDDLFAAEGHNASSTRAFIMRFYRIDREANFNMVRYQFFEGGNPYSADLNVADELGFLVEPEGSSQEVPPLSNGESNFDDPVFRKNAQTFHRAFARKIRTHPSAVILSLSNEVFQCAGDFLDDAAKYYLAMEKIVQEEIPEAVLTEQGNNWRKEFATADVHYSGGIAFKDWAKKGDRPLIHGEWSFYEGGYFEMNYPDPAKAKAATVYAAQSFEREIKSEIAYGVAGTMPFPAFWIYSFATGDESVMGPWAKEIATGGKHFHDPNRWYLPHAFYFETPVQWPAQSGKGVKIRTMLTGTQFDNINFFDPTRKEFTPNGVYFAFKRAFTPMPPLRPVISPEVIATVDPKQAGLPVFAVQEGNPLLMGVLPDPDGKAWFELPSPGDYEFSRIDQPGMKTLKFTATEKPLAQPPGFGYIDRIDLK